MIKKICSTKLLPKALTMNSTIQRHEKGSNITLTNVINEKLVLTAC